MKKEEHFKDMSNENRELFIRALSDAAEAKFNMIDEEIQGVELPPPSKRHKIQMNRIFRECEGSSFIPFPEVDI